MLGVELYITVPAWFFICIRVIVDCSVVYDPALGPKPAVTIFREAHSLMVSAEIHLRESIHEFSWCWQLLPCTLKPHEPLSATGLPFPSIANTFHAYFFPSISFGA